MIIQIAYLSLIVLNLIKLNSIHDWIVIVDMDNTIIVKYILPIATNLWTMYWVLMRHLLSYSVMYRLALYKRWEIETINGNINFIYCFKLWLVIQLLGYFFSEHTAWHLPTQVLGLKALLHLSLQLYMQLL